MTTQFNPMTGSRGIEWTDVTINATGGCNHECRWEMPDGTVAVCYAKTLAESGVAKKAYPHGFQHHYWRPHMLQQLAAGKTPKLIFCDSMADMFAAEVPPDHVVAILDAMREAPYHTYQSLTKAAPQLLKYVDKLPPNLWVGVSSLPDWFRGRRLTRPQQEAMLRKSMNVLAEVKERTGNIVWMSAEPVSWDLAATVGPGHPLDWAVVGAASNGRKTFQPCADDIAALLRLFDGTTTPVFFKGNIGPLFNGDGLGDAALNRWREDFPVTYRNGTPIPAVAERQKRCRQHGWTRIALPVV